MMPNVAALGVPRSLIAKPRCSQPSRGARDGGGRPAAHGSAIGGGGHRYRRPRWCSAGQAGRNGVAVLGAAARRQDSTDRAMQALARRPRSRAAKDRAPCACRDCSSSDSKADARRRGCILRLFFAVLPPVEIRSGIADAALRLPLEAGSAPVPPENYHMTLAFIGEVPAMQLAPCARIGAAQRACAFTVRLDAYEYWPKPRWWRRRAREIPAALARLWERLQAALASHRVGGQSPAAAAACDDCEEGVASACAASDVCIRLEAARTFSLMQSTRSGARPSRGVQPIYTVVDTLATTG